MRTQFRCTFCLFVAFGLGLGCHSERVPATHLYAPHDPLTAAVAVDVWGGVNQCGIVTINPLATCYEIASLAGGLNKALFFDGAWRVYKGINSGKYIVLDRKETLEPRLWENGDVLLVPFVSTNGVWPEESLHQVSNDVKVLVMNYVVKEGWHRFSQRTSGAEILRQCGGADSHKFRMLRFYSGLRHYTSRVDGKGSFRRVQKEYIRLSTFKTNSVLSLQQGDLLYFSESL